MATDVRVSWLQFDTLGVVKDVRASWLQFDTLGVVKDVRASWIQFDTLGITKDVRASWIQFDTLVPQESRQGDGTGWDSYSYIHHKTVKQFKKEFELLSYEEIKKEKHSAEIRLKLARAKLIEASDFGFDYEITRLKLIIAIELNKIKALQYLEDHKIAEAKVLKLKKDIERDLVFIAAYMLEDEYD